MALLWGLLLGLCCCLAAAARHPVFWNSSNPRFLVDDYTVVVQLNDYLDIICPHYEAGREAPEAMERYTLYLVEQEEFRACKPSSKEQVRWECNKPAALHGPERFSEKFQRFTPFTLGREFKEGHSYYYISKPIHHHGKGCLKLRVIVAGKASGTPTVHTPLRKGDPGRRRGRPGPEERGPEFGAAERQPRHLPQPPAAPAGAARPVRRSLPEPHRLNAGGPHGWEGPSGLLKTRPVPARPAPAA